MTKQHTENKATFDTLGIMPELLTILQAHKYVTPTPIQAKAIPDAVKNYDIIGIAQTGTGKTLAFGIPMIQSLMQKGGKGLVVLPTRELALQVDETFQKIGKPLGLRTAVLIGGASMERQVSMIRKNPHVVIATPGRILDHLEQKTVKLDAVRVLVLDEADRMLDMGFAPQIKRLLTAVPAERQTLLFSATMPEDIVRIAAQHMKSPIRIEVARQGTAAETVKQELYCVHQGDKARLLEKILADNRNDTVLVFSRTKHGARKIKGLVQTMGHTAAEIHSNKSLAQRTEALKGFKTGKYRILVATDIAARGIDVTNIGIVINYDLPDNPEDYIHRIGRTGRAGMEGRAISFGTPDQAADVRAIEKLMRTWLPLTPLPKELPPSRSMPVIPRESSRFGHTTHRPASRGFGGRAPNRHPRATGGPSHNPRSSHRVQSRSR